MTTRKEIARRMREVLQSGREEVRELTLHAQNPGDTATIDASGAINLTIRDFLEDPENALGLPPGLELQMGVEGNELWPVSIDDVEMEEEDETAALTDQTLHFDKILMSNPVRTGITVEVSNSAIDNAGFDLLGFIKKKFTRAQKQYIARHLFSSALFDGNRGPFAYDYDRFFVLGSNVYGEVLEKMTELHNAGFDTSEAVIVMAPFMEVVLKLTEAVPGSGRTVIQDGLCCGYPYVVNRYFNTTLDEDGQLVPKDSVALGIAMFKYFKIAQHGKARLTVNGKTNDVAVRDVTAVTLNTAWSFTNLADYLPGDAGDLVFVTMICDMGYLADNGGRLFETIDGKYLLVTFDGRGGYSVYLADKDGHILDANNDLLTVGLQNIQ